MASGEFATLGNAQKLLGMLVQTQARVRIGTESLYGSLETSSTTYTNYNTPIGLTSNSFDLGVVSELGLTINQTVEPYESANERQATIYVVTEEETLVNIGVTQFDRRVLELCLATGVAIDLETASNPEYLFTWGGGCTIKSRPIEIDASNIACFVEEQNANTGVTGIRITVYDAICTSGLPWDTISATELNTLSLEFSGRPVSTHALGNLLGNCYVF